MPHPFAVRDVRHGSVKRVAAAVGEGSTAVSFVHEYLAEAAAQPGGPGLTARPARQGGVAGVGGGEER